MPHGYCSFHMHVAILSARWQFARARTIFWPNFQGWFWRPSGTQNGSYSILLESPRSLLSKDINCAQIRVWTEKLWLLEVGVSELFFRVFPAKIPAKRGKLPANRELRLVSGVAVFLRHLSLRIKSQWAGRNLRTKAVVREKKRVRFSGCFSYVRQFLRAW